MRHVASALALLLFCATTLFAQETTTTTAFNPIDDDCTKDDPKQTDCRGSFEASFYIGGAVDTFAGNETLNYLNPGDAGKSTLREVAGFDFAYRLFGNRRTLADGTKSRFPRGSQLWVYGETVHGVRSKEVQCKDEAGNATGSNNLPACSGSSTAPTVPGTNELLAIIKGATSLEAFVGLRWEVAPLASLLQNSELDRARFYVKWQSGVINVSGGGDSADQHHLALGAMAVSGPLEGSYLEFGYGRNDLMVKNHTGRFKIDGFLSADPRAVPMFGFIDDARIRPFAQLTIDADFAGGADSLQTYFGVDYTFGGTK